MNARLPINKKQKARIREEVAAEYKRQGDDISRRIFKLFCVALNRRCGFGKERINRLLDFVNQLGVDREHDEVFWYHIDKIVIDQMGVEFERENYEVMDR